MSLLFGVKGVMGQPKPGNKGPESGSNGVGMTPNLVSWVCHGRCQGNYVNYNSSNYVNYSSSIG